MPSERLPELAKQLVLKGPASEAAIADVMELTGAQFPADLLDFMRQSNGAYREALLMLNPVEDWVVDTVDYEALAEGVDDRQ